MSDIKQHTTITIDGKQVFEKSIYNVIITQTIGKHNEFSIKIPASAIEGYDGALMDKSIKNIGKPISINYKRTENDEGFIFNGIVSDVRLDKSDTGIGDVCISGYSPDIILSKRYNCRSFVEGTALSDIFQQILGEHGLDYVDTFDDEDLPYTVQYNETDYEFISRLCKKQGIWLYHSGEDFCIGLENKREEIEGIYGLNITEFSLAASLQEQTFSINQHDWVNNKEYNAESVNSQSSKGKHTYLDTIKQNSDSEFGNTDGYYFSVHNQIDYTKEKGMNKMVDRLTLNKSASMLRAKGKTELDNLTIGDTLKIQSNSFSDKSKKDAYGSFTLTKLRHKFKSTGEYSNIFEGVPEGTSYLSPDNLDKEVFLFPKGESQRAVIVDNEDPEGLGRVKVRFPWQVKDNNDTPWIKMSTPYGGSGKGFYFIPEKDEEVLIGFEGNNSERPFVLSTGFNKESKSNIDNAGNNKKAIKTKKHSIEFDDGANKLTISDGSGNIVEMSDESIHFTAAKNVIITAGENCEITAGKEIKITAGTDYSVQAGSKMQIQSGTDLSVQSGTKFDLQAGTEVSIKGGAKIDISSIMIGISASAMTEIKGAQVKLN